MCPSWTMVAMRKTTSHMWVISLAYASNKGMEDLKIL